MARRRRRPVRRRTLWTQRTIPTTTCSIRGKSYRISEVYRVKNTRTTADESNNCINITVPNNIIWNTSSSSTIIWVWSIWIPRAVFREVTQVVPGCRDANQTSRPSNSASLMKTKYIIIDDSDTSQAF